MSQMRRVAGYAGFGRVAAVVTAALSVVVVLSSTAQASSAGAAGAQASTGGSSTVDSPIDVLGMPLGAVIWLAVGVIAVFGGLFVATRRPAVSPALAAAEGGPAREFQA
jgi:hypothetical protein